MYEKEIKIFLSGLIPPIEPNREVKFVVSGEKLCPVSLDFPTEAQYVTCPDCLGSVGFYNVKWDAWSCASDKCLSKWKGKKSKEEGVKTRFRVQGLSETSLESSNFKEMDQSEDRKLEWIKWAKNPFGCLVLAGPSGTGKSYVAAAILRAFCEETGKSGRFLNISEMYLEWKDKVSQGKDIDLALKLTQCDLLVIDDLGQRVPTDSFLEFLYIVISRRNDRKKASIVTTNLTYVEMRQRLGDAIASRFTAGKVYKFTGKDRRKQPEW